MNGWRKRGGKSFKMVVLWLDVTKDTDPFILLCHTQCQLHPLMGSNKSPIPEPHPHKTRSIKRKRPHFWLFRGAKKHLLEPPLYRLPLMPIPGLITGKENEKPVNQAGPPGAEHWPASLRHVHAFIGMNNWRKKQIELHRRENRRMGAGQTSITTSQWKN